MTERLARAAARRPWRMLIAWLAAIALAVGAVGAFLGDGLTTEAFLTNEPESERAYEVLAEHFPVGDSTTELVVVRHEQLTVNDPAFQARIAELDAEAADLVDRAGQPVPAPDGHAVLLPIRLVEPAEDTVERAIELVESEDGRDGFQIAMTGEFTSDRGFNELSQSDLEEGELQFGLPAALVVLVLVFGAVVASTIPLVLGLVSIAVALGLTALASTGWELSVFSVNMLTGMGLALGIDYALFVVSRFREERSAGREKVDAIAAAGATASRAVLFSGSAFVVAMLGLLLVQSTIMRSIAAGAIFAGIVSVVAALTLLPAVLSLLGDRVNRLRIPYFGRQRLESRMWGAIVRRVVARPALSLAVAVAVLLAAAAPALTMKIGGSGIATLPDHLASKQGYLALERSFPAGGADPAEIVVEAPAGAPATRAAIERLTAALERDTDFGPPTVEEAPDGEAVLVRAPLPADALGARAIEAVERLRAEYVPAAFAGTGEQALVTGATAENIDYFEVMRFWLPVVIAIVLALSFVLLTVAFRSVVVAGTAIALNLLSVGAAYGIVVAVFQHGVGAGLLGFQQVDTIEAWVPPFLFAVLFGLSMDYQVFLLSRIRERYTATRDNRDAITFGIGSTARIITGAALIIMAVFLGFARGDLVMFQQMGFGVAVALLIDATIVRSVLVPAAMQLLGERNWYLPAWLRWLPHVEVERHESEPRPEAVAA